MTRNEKMLKIMSCLKGRQNYQETTHQTADYGRERIGYYYATDDYFDLKYKGFEVNISGKVGADNIDRVADFNVNKWLDELVSITSQKICIIDGKEYIMVDTEGVENEKQ